MSRANSPLRDRMIFCVGAQRSGTTWLQRMLAVHPDVVTIPSETQLLSVGMATVAWQIHQGPMSSTVTARTFMEADAFADAARDFCDAVFGDLARTLDPSARYILERSPNHAEQLRLVAGLYPDARVVHIVRDGRDVARSVVAQGWGPEQIGAAARQWRTAVEAARAAGPDVAVYAEVRYEDLLADPRSVYTDLLTRLGLATDPAVVEAGLAEAGRAVNVDASRPRIGSGKWQASWTQRDLDAFDAAAGELLYETLGYPRLPPLAHRRGLAGRVRATMATRLRRGNAAPAPGPGPGRGGLPALQMAPTPLHVTDAMTGLLATGEVGRALAMLAPDAHVRVVDGGGSREARGAAGRTLLEQVLRGEGAGWGRQLRGDVHAGTPRVTHVLRHERDGVRTDRVLAMRVRGAAVTSLTYYRFPDGGAPA